MKLRVDVYFKHLTTPKYIKQYSTHILCIM